LLRPIEDAIFYRLLGIFIISQQKLLGAGRHSQQEQGCTADVVRHKTHFERKKVDPHAKSVLGIEDPHICEEWFFDGLLVDNML
jgi:hypothetical protein